jgi:FHS family L-fucose permease-like MFS transporter
LRAALTWVTYTFEGMSKTKQSQLYTLIIVFFFWGFVAASNGIFIPFCKAHFSLSQFQSQLIDLTFYGGYFVGSVLLFIYTTISKNDLLNRIGYKKGIVYGLGISALGALAIIPAVYVGSFALILGAFFIVALGFSLQQTSAQPYAASLGTPETGAHRLNLAGGINSLGTTLGPIIVSYLLFGSIGGNSSGASISSISNLYLIMAGLFVAMMVFFAATGLQHTSTQSAATSDDFGALKYPQLTLGMLAIFVYVGVEVTIQSNMGALLKLPDFGGYTESQLSPFISLYWGSLMIGRWTGALSVFNLNTLLRNVLSVVVPFIAFGVVLFVNNLNGHDVSTMYIYALPIAAMIGVNFLSNQSQSKALILFSVFGLIAMLIGIFTTGQVAIYAFISGGLACSVLWPCIFSLAIHGLGKYTGQGSAFLIMMIFGGAIIPPLQGLLADYPAIGIHNSYWITVLCFGYLVFYGVKVQNVLQKQGLQVDNAVAQGH